jgi:hypothetical protein
MLMSNGRGFAARGNHRRGGAVETDMAMRSRRVRGLWAVVAGAAVVLLVTGCAQGSVAGTGGQAASSSVPSATLPPSTPSSPPTSGAGGGVVVRGTVRQGVEPGCLLLDAQDKRAYLLLDADPSTVRPGARVEVVGRPVDRLASFCGEGTALSVVSARPLR